MNNPDWLLSIKDLKSEYFYNPTNKIIFHVIDKIYEDNKESSLEPFVLLGYIRDENIAFELQVEKSGGLSYLETVKEVSEDYTKADLLKQAEIVKTLSYMRDLVNNLDKTNEYVQNGSHKTIEDVNTFIDESQKKLRNKYTIRDSYTYVGDVLDETLEEMKKQVKNGIVGYPSKITTLNKYMTYRNGELVIVGARAKAGKSTFALNEAHNLAIKNNVPVLYLDTEMQTSTFIMRMLALDSGLPIRIIENFSYLNNVETKRKVEESLERIRKAPVIHKYSYNWTREKVRNDVLALKRTHNIEFLIYDYIKIKTVGDSRTPEHNELGNWAIFLKDLAGELNIPVFTMAQMSPYEVRLADSDKLNRYASVVAFLLPLNENMRGKLIQKGCRCTKDYIYIEYNRNGASMERNDKGVYVDYTRENATFKEAPYQERVEDLSR